MPVPEAVRRSSSTSRSPRPRCSLPVVATAVAPARTERWLRAAQDWLTAHGAVLTAVVAALVGVVLVVDGVGRF